ncbi:MAG: thioredoxin family protein [Deltaproteobacteria bacterium]|nr:thioredoxin family protein [Deltaproteobacteria bacterium]MBW1934104.1 thioredoxin family protein [Deltaproteobacteria bacterium]MBW1976849.1 thioredoxin family protein [Deltaproteobacteria bacterium]MBW2043875.1 thioredoxin family protein [Deltaproteobacteria bacterium]MBW2300048.1 thioredoxin family protein [Deltaproteobacteria bacterium]
MRKIAFTLILSFGLVVFLSPFSRAFTVSFNVASSADQYEAGKNYPLLFKLEVSPPWYIHDTVKEGNGVLIPTRLSFKSIPGIEIRKIQFPPPQEKRFEYASRPLSVFSGTILVKATLAISKRARNGEHLIKGELSYQACSSSSCLPPEKVAVSVPIRVIGSGMQGKNAQKSPGASGVQADRVPSGFTPGAALWLTLLGFFLGGLALNLTPCIYPLIPITISYFAGKSSSSRGHAIAHATVYMVGLAITNSILGLWAALSGRILGSALQNPYVLVFLAALLVALGLSSFGVWEFRVPGKLTTLGSKNYGGHFGSFFMGLTLGIVAAPCLGPFVLGLLTYVGQKGDPYFGFLSFFVLSIGLGLPLAVLALFSGVASRLPLSGDWMIWIKKLMGWVLVGMAAYMLSLLFSDPFRRSALISSIALAAGIHLGLLERTGKHLRVFSIFKKSIGAALVCGAVFYSWSTYGTQEGIKWRPYDETLLRRAAKDKKPVILDFYAEWCTPCRSMDDDVFKDPKIVDMSKSFVTLRLDLTRRLPYQDKILKKYNVRGVPTVIFLDKSGSEEKQLRIQSPVSKSEFLRRMRSLLENPAPNRTSGSNSLAGPKYCLLEG